MGYSRYRAQSLRLRRSRVTVRTKTKEMTLPLFPYTYDSIKPNWLYASKLKMCSSTLFDWMITAIAKHLPNCTTN